MADTWKHDVFVSYSHSDTTWVRDELLPRMKRWGVRYAVDFEDFEAGRSIVLEMERFVVQSRRLLLVLTPKYVNSDFTQFEYQLGRLLDPEARRARVVPVVREDCQIPAALAGIAPIHLTDPVSDLQWARLRDCLTAEVLPSSLQLGFHAHVSRDLGSRDGHSYRVDLLVGNPWPFSVTFETINLTFDRSAASSGHRFGLTECVIYNAKGKRCSEFFYDDDEPSPRAPGRLPEGATCVEPWTLEPNKATMLPFLSTPRVAATMPGSGPLVMSAVAATRGVPVSDVSACAMPPILRLPVLQQRGTEGSTQIDMIPSAYRPSDSGISNPEIAGVICDTAYDAARDAVLVRVQPEGSVVHKFDKGGFRHSVINWCYHFYSEEMGGSFYIHRDDPTYVIRGTDERAERPHLWMGREILSHCVVDCGAAYLVGAESGGTAVEKGPIKLEPGVVDGRQVPVWSVPFETGGRPLGVSAETGDVLSLGRGGEWSKLQQCIWNK